jgi:glycosyltransferase involved in cell wall biosynthesis
MPDPIYFAYPGDLDTRTGGYHYDRRLIAELRQRDLPIETLSLPHCAPQPDQASLAHIASLLAALPDQSIVIIDGLAFGVLDAIAEAESDRLRLLALCHHPLALESGLDDSLQARLLTSERRALACARATLVTSEHTRRILVEQFALPQEKITVALPGTESVDFAPCAGEPPLLLTLASLTPRKAHDVLLAALAELKDLPWRARFVGDDSLAPDWVARLRQQLESLGLTERIELTGVVSDHLAEYQQADVFVLPSRFEGYGMVFAEATAAGLPVVAARAGAVPDVVPPSAGLLVPPDDSAALALALRSLLRDTDLRRRLQRGAQQAAAHLPRWTETGAIVSDLLNRVAKQ